MDFCSILSLKLSYMFFSKAIAFILILSFHCSLSLNGQTILSELDSLFKRVQTEQNFSGFVLIADHGKVIYEKGLGYADQEMKTSMNAQSVFKIASITKSITAIIIMQLIEENKLQLTQSIKDVLPGLDIHRADSISIHHLLLHISGLPKESDTIFHHYHSPEEIIRTTTQDKSRYQNFESFHYTNVDYLILGLMIEKVTGQSWQYNVQKRIFDPVNMTQSGFAQKDQMPKQNVLGYIIGEDGSTTKEPSYFIENFGAAACLYATAEDLLKLDQALYQDVLLTDKSKEIMYSSYPEFGYVGYGSWVYQYPFLESQPKVIERRGGLPGFNHVFIRMPELHRTIIVLSNNNLFDTDTFGKSESLKEQLIQLVATKT